MKPILKCIHPLVPVSVGIFFLLVAILPGHVGIEELLPVGRGGHGSVPVFLLFFPSYFMFLLGIGFSAIRLWEIRCARCRSREKAQ